jgi:L-lactate utilization protein LutB
MFDKPASATTIQKVLEATAKRNILSELVANKEQALARIKAIIPDSASVMTGGSVTLREIGLTKLLKSGAHPWKNLKGDIATQTDPIKEKQMRRAATLADFFLGSVNAITEDGEIFIASNSGSQLPAYAYSSRNIIWVAGVQKIVKDFETARARVYQYVLPLEDKRQKGKGGKGSQISKLLIFEREKEGSDRTVRLILVNESIGF